MSKFQRFFTPDEDALIIDGHAAGLTWNQIAETLDGRSARTARIRASKIGIHHCRKVTDEVPCPIKSTAKLRDAMEREFAAHSRRVGVDYLDARSLLMDGRLAV